MRARIKWIGDVAFVGESGSGHALVLDGSPDHGGRNIGVRPMEALLIGVGACSAFDVVTILRIDVRLARTSFIRVAWLALRCSDGLLARWLSFRGAFGSRGGAFIVGIEAECNPKHQRTCSADG